MDERLKIKLRAVAYCSVFIIMCLATLFGCSALPETTHKAAVETNYTPLIWLVVFIVPVLAFFKIKALFLKSHPRLLLVSLYTRYDINSDKETISLYYLHQIESSKQIRITDITQSEIFLNDKLINTVNKKEGYGFSKNIDNTIQSAFASESRFKMIEKRIRKIHMIITCQRNKKHLVCLYLREGNQRLTRAPYQEVITSVTHWCWHISRTINPENTEVQ
jgi:hypothetical protein